MEMDDRVGFNVRKRQILRLLDGRAMTPDEVAREVGITGDAARHLLRRYHVSGLLSRTEGEGSWGRRPYVYTRTRQGRKILPRIRERPRRG